MRYRIASGVVLVGLALGPYRLAWYLRIDGRLVPLPIALVGEA